MKVHFMFNKRVKNKILRNYKIEHKFKPKKERSLHFNLINKLIQAEIVLKIDLLHLYMKNYLNKLKKIKKRKKNLLIKNFKRSIPLNLKLIIQLLMSILKIKKLLFKN